MLRIWPDARFIHIVRDGRDVARSCMGMNWAGNVWTGIDRWIEVEQLWSQLKETISPEQYTEVCYESLITEPVETLTHLCNFIGTSYDPAMLGYAQTTTYDLPNSKLLWQWKRKLSEREIQLVEARIGDMLLERGYELTSLFSQLPSPLVRQSFDDVFGQQWNQAIASAALKMSGRDRLGSTGKSHLYELVRQFGGAYVLSKRKLRLLFSLVMPSLRQPDWVVPWWFANLHALEQASTVLKLNQIPAWAEWVLRNNSATIVIHIVRHPAGFLNSWRKRYLAEQDSVKVRRSNEERLTKIADSDERWAKLFGNVRAMTLDELELWYWRYASETIDVAGDGQANYLRIIYEDLVSDTLKVSKQLYEKCDLPWTLAIEKAIFNSASCSNLIATAWRKNLMPEQISVVKKVMAGSFMSQWWDDFNFKPDNVSFTEF